MTWGSEGLGSSPEGSFKSTRKLSMADIYGPRCGIRVVSEEGHLGQARPAAGRGDSSRCSRTSPRTSPSASSGTRVPRNCTLLESELYPDGEPDVSMQGPRGSDPGRPVHVSAWQTALALAVRIHVRYRTKSAAPKCPWHMAVEAIEAVVKISSGG